MNDPPTTHQVARKGVELASEQLRQRGAAPAPVGAGRSRNHLRVRTPRGDVLSVFVTSRRVGDWQTDTRKGQPREEDPDETEFWLFVDLLDDPPGFYIAPAWWVENDIHKNHQAYLERHGGQRARNPDATHHRITTDRVLRWRDRWDLLHLRPDL